MNQYESAAIVAKMLAMRETMSKSEQRVIDTITAEPHDVIHLSVSELAHRSQVSDPTVIRTCRKLGLEGYQDLKLTLARELVNPLQLINEDICDNDDTQTVVSKTFRSIIKTMDFTLQTLNIPDLEKVLDYIVNAKRIAVVGFGNSHSVASDLQHKLMRVGYPATYYGDPYLAAIAITYFKPGDVLFCISHSGSSSEVIELAQMAKEKGAAVLCVTKSGISPLSKIATVSLFTSSSESNYRIIGLNSRFAQLAIIDSIHALLNLRSKGEGEELLMPEDSVKHFNY